MAVEMSEKMQQYMSERVEQKQAVLDFAKLLSGNLSLGGLSLEVLCRRVKEISEQMRKGNLDSANEEFLEMMAEVEKEGEKTFVFDSHKFSNDYGRTIYTYTGDVGKEIKAIDLEIEGLEKKKKATIAAAKVMEKNVRTKQEPPKDAKFKVSQVAPKKKPAK